MPHIVDRGVTASMIVLAAWPCSQASKGLSTKPVRLGPDPAPEPITERTAEISHSIALSRHVSFAAGIDLRVPGRVGELH